MYKKYLGILLWTAMITSFRFWSLIKTFCFLCIGFSWLIIFGITACSSWFSPTRWFWKKLRATNICKKCNIYCIDDFKQIQLKKKSYRKFAVLEVLSLVCFAHSVNKCGIKHKQIKRRNHLHKHLHKYYKVSKQRPISNTLSFFGVSRGWFAWLRRLLKFHFLVHFRSFDVFLKRIVVRR